MLTVRYRTLALVMVIPLLLVAMFFVGVRSASALTDNCFTDVTTGMWFHDYVCWMFDAGLTTGYPDGTYHPYNNITRAEVAVMMQQISGAGSVGPVVDADKIDGLEASAFYTQAEVDALLVSYKQRPGRRLYWRQFAHTQRERCNGRGDQWSWKPDHRLQ